MLKAIRKIVFQKNILKELHLLQLVCVSYMQVHQVANNVATDFTSKVEVKIQFNLFMCLSFEDGVFSQKNIDTQIFVSIKDEIGMDCVPV